MKKLEKLIPGSDAWRKVMDADLPPVRITEKTRQTTKDNALRFRGGVRLSNGMFYTDEEYEAWRQQVLAMPLP